MRLELPRILRTPLILLAAAAPIGAQSTHLLREPTVSRAHIAFAYAGDIWIAPRGGGDARRLTSFPGVESNPKLSPDGRLVAFTAEYGGNEDVFVVPVEGGQPKRLTWHPGSDIVRGWSPDGKRVIFASGRTSVPVPYLKLWSISLDGGLPAPLPLPRVYKGHLSDDAQRIVYQMVAPNDLEWRNYRGGQTQPIRIYDVRDERETKLPWSGSVDSDPVWVGNDVYFISDRDSTANVYRYAPSAGTVEQVTRFKDYDVKNLDAGGGALVFEHGGTIHLYDPAAKAEREVPITARGDLPWAMPHWEDVADKIASASLSPTGVRAVFEARGDVFTVPVEKGNWRNLTHSPGAADRSPVWSPDGKHIAWFSDASGEYRLMIGDQEGVEKPREITLPNPTFYFTPAWSPDSKHIAFTDEGLNVWWVDVATGKATKVDTDQFMVPSRTIDPSWSPDSRWLAYSKRLDNQFHAVFVYSMADGSRHQITDGLSDALAPAWDAGGKYLYFLASTTFGLNTGWLDMSSYERPVTRSIYLAVLRADDPSPLLPESDEEKAARQSDTTTRPQPKPDAKPPAAAAAPSAAETKGNEPAKPAAPVPDVRIDFDRIGQRILSLDVPDRDYQHVTTAGTGVVFYTERVPNEMGLVLHRYDLAKRTTAPFLSGVATYAVSADGKKLLYRVRDQWGVVGTAGPAKAGDGAIHADLRMMVEPIAEWQQIFKEAWRLERDFFYVKNMHGADWNKVYAMYSPWVADVGHRSDLSNLLDVLGGELSVGHSFVFGGAMPKIDRTPIGLLGADLSEANGRYRLTRILSGENWNPGLRAPLSGPGVKVNAGDYLLAVNGVELRAPTSPYSLFEGTVGRQTILLINDRPSAEGAREVVVVPVADESGLRTRAWIEDNRRLVDKLSGGKLAYLWLPNTAGAGYTSFNRYYFAQQNKQGAVIDERYNGGGSAADYMVDIMARRLQGFFNNPVAEHKPFTVPQAGIWGPKVMLINDAAGSGGDLLPFLFHQMNLGPLVGTRTWGGLVGIWDAPSLIDGGIITTPRGGFYNMKGQWDVENVGVAPDVMIEMTPKEVNAGHDPQLERGVQEAMRLLEAHPVAVLPEPASPVRPRRP